jgi:hypothetical protein
MSWFVAGFVLLVRAAPEKSVPPQPKVRPPISKSGRGKH